MGDYALMLLTPHLWVNAYENLLVVCTLSDLYLAISRTIQQLSNFLLSRIEQIRKDKI
jgi:hypothetical protein